MKIIYNDIIPFKGFTAINLAGTLYVRNEYKGKLTNEIMNHEEIHSAQMNDLGYVLFYLLYIVEWVYKIFTVGFKDAYYNISFEKEAYSNQNNLDYLKTRQKFAFWK